MKKNSVVAVAWVATGLAVSVAIFVTKSPYPLFGLFIPYGLTDLKKLED
ncbi:hypothetical protein [Oceanirhabdus sp. W0125-5]|nr:hypothetical protein [Oceanirhabdus sp. W0125-5]WBW96556.1 hypothetical protein OW730_23115 [Oceanirhabdus sp. W0125-5]